MSAISELLEWPCPVIMSRASLAGARRAALGNTGSSIAARRRNDADAPVLVSVRIPKSGSASLTAILREGCAHRRIFFLPNTLPGDGAFSLLQRLRAARARLNGLWWHHSTFSLDQACEKIAAEAEPGDLIDGGHIDFTFARTRIARPLKMITILRDPAARVLSEYNYAREGYWKKAWPARFDAGVLHQVAAHRSFDGYLDFLGDHAHLYGNLAARYVGWDGKEALGPFFRRWVFHAGVLEERTRFAAGLSQKLGRPLAAPLAFPHANPTKHPLIARLTRTQRARIDALYPLDSALHRWAAERL